MSVLGGLDNLLLRVNIMTRLKFVCGGNRNWYTTGVNLDSCTTRPKRRDEYLEGAEEELVGVEEREGGGDDEGLLGLGGRHAHQLHRRDRLVAARRHCARTISSRSWHNNIIGPLFGVVGTTANVCNDRSCKICEFNAFCERRTRTTGA